MALDYGYIEDCIRIIAKLKEEKGDVGRLNVAMLGYQAILLTVEEAKALVGDEVYKKLRIRIDVDGYSPGFGVRTIPVRNTNGELEAEIKKLFGKDKYDGDREITSIPYHVKKGRYFFEPLSFLGALGCYCQCFDMAPRHGVETSVDLSKPFDASFHGKFDLIIDGGTTEHTFAVSEVLKNVVRLLSPGGVVMHSVPMMVTGAGVYYLGMVNYCLDPGLYRDFYRLNGFEVLDSCYYHGKTKKLIPLENGVHTIDGDALIHYQFTARKTNSMRKEIAEPLQLIYDHFYTLGDAYPYGPLLHRGRTVVADSGFEERTPLSSPVEPFFDAVVRNMKWLGGDGAVRDVLSDPAGACDPYDSPQRALHAMLAEKNEERTRREAARLSGKSVYYVIKNYEMFSKWKHAFKDSVVVAALMHDTAVDVLPGLSFDGIPMVSMEKAAAAMALLPIVVFGRHDSIADACRQVYHFYYPERDVEIIPCWE